MSGWAFWSMPTDRPTYPFDVSDEEPALLREDLAKSDHDLREVFNGLR